MLARLLGFLILGLGLLLAILNPPIWVQGLFSVEILATLIGVACFLYPPFAKAKCELPSTLEKKTSLRQDLSVLYLGQFSLIFLAFLFFDTLELQTRLNPRMQALETGHLFSLIKNNSLRLGLMPWVVYAILGVGLCFLSTCRQRTPYLPKAMIPNHRKQPMAFLYNFLCLIVEGGTTYPIIFVSAFTLIYFCETINMVFGWNSLFSTPYLTLFVMALLMLGSRRLKNQLIDKMIRHQLSVGYVLVLYIIVVSFLLLMMHTVGENFLPNNQGVQLQALGKNSIAASFSEAIVKMRLELLIWGWWGMWTPWMTSFIARFSINHMVGRSFLFAALLPTLLFGFLLHSVSLEHWLVFSAWLQIPSIKVILSLLLLLFIWTLWGKMHNTADVSRGFMMSWGRWRCHPLKKWMTGLLMLMSCFLPTWFMSGWVPVQIFATFSASFIVVLLVLFIGILISASRPKPVLNPEYT